MALAKIYNETISESDYLQGELISEVKHELIDGYAYAMAGASISHNRIVTNITGEFHSSLKNTPCEPFSSDMKVKVADNFYYPDSMVVCDQKSNDFGITDAPLIIVEVLSKSTRRIDHTLKRTAYQQLPSLQEYVIIEQDLVDIEVCRRNKHWQSEHYYLGDDVFFGSINLNLSVVDIYDRVVNSDIHDYLEKLKEEDQSSIIDK